MPFHFRATAGLEDVQTKKPAQMTGFERALPPRPPDTTPGRRAVFQAARIAGKPDVPVLPVFDTASQEETGLDAGNAWSLICGCPPLSCMVEETAQMGAW